MSFSKILGHKAQIEIFQHAVVQNRIAHAYLFAGSEGIGKRRFAFEVAKMLNCGEKGEDACDHCLACRKMDNGNHPDLITLAPDGIFIKVAQIRQLQHDLSFKPYEGPYRIVIMDQADQMHGSAANAILKTLEEPPAKTVFFLISSKPHLLLPTVRSRCQSIRFSPIPKDEILRSLLQRGIAEQRAEVIASLAHGSLGHAMKIETGDDLVSFRHKLIQRLEPLSFRQMDAILNFAEELSKSEEIEPTLEFLLCWYRDLLITRFEGDTQYNIDLRPLMTQSSANHLSIQALLTRLDAIHQALKSIKQNANRLMIMENLLLTLCTPAEESL